MKKATTENATRANTRGLISRSLTITTVTILVYSKANRETAPTEYSFEGTKTDDEIIKAYNKATPDFIALDIIDRKTETHLYAMSVDKFIKNADIYD